MRALLLLLICSVVTSCVRFPHPAATAIQPRTTMTKPIWLICGRLHSDFVAETQWLLDHGCKLPASMHAYKYTCFGWGDHIAYTRRWGSQDIPNALLWPSNSIVQVVGFNTPVTSTFPQQEVIRAQVPAYRGRHLANFLNHSFEFRTPESHTPITLRDAKWGHGYFIKSPYSYYLPRMCNQWVAEAFLQAGITTTKPRMTMTSQSLKKDLQQFVKGEL